MKKDKLTIILKNTLSIILVIALFTIIFYQNRDRDTLKFGHSESNELLSTGDNSLSSFTSGSASSIGENIAFLTTTSYSVHNKSGDINSINLAFSEPVLHTEGEYAVCYELNSTKLYVFKESSKLYDVSTDNKVFLAKVNRNGYLFTATEKDGYNCECVVYNRNGEPIFKWDVSKSEFLDGDINYENDKIMLSLASSGENKLVGEIVLISILDAKIINRKEYNSCLFFTVDFNNNGTCVGLGNDSVKYFNSDGTEKWSYSFENKKLLKADLSNHDTLVLAFSGSGELFDGNSTEVKTISKLGKVIAEKTYNGNVEDVSVGKSNIALAIDKKIYITDSNLKEKKSIKTDYSIKKVTLFNDDEHVFALGSVGGKIFS